MLKVAVTIIVGFVDAFVPSSQQDHTLVTIRIERMGNYARSFATFGCSLVVPDGSKVGIIPMVNETPVRCVTIMTS